MLLQLLLDPLLLLLLSSPRSCRVCEDDRRGDCIAGLCGDAQKIRRGEECDVCTGVKLVLGRAVQALVADGARNEVIRVVLVTQLRRSDMEKRNMGHVRAAVRTRESCGLVRTRALTQPINLLGPMLGAAALP